MHILVVEDDDLTRMGMESSLKGEGVVSSCASLVEALDLINTQKFDLAFIDLDLEKELAGLEVIKSAANKNIYSVVVSGRESDGVITSAYEIGCNDYLNKPFTDQSLSLVMEKFKVIHNLSDIKEIVANQYVTNDPDIISQLEVIKEIVVSKQPVFITGPTGVGKTRLAKIIHEKVSTEGKEPFIHLNCSELPENLLEGELFGYEKGAFTGATMSKKGKLELADGGTLFLDEIATMPVTLQQKLLRVIEEKTFYPLGSESQKSSSFRLITATCEDLKEMIGNGDFREDLYFRIEGHNIDIKPLSQRRGDIEILIKFFLRNTPRRIVLSDDVKDLLQNYTWPGNVRELEKCIGLLTAKPQGVIKLEDLPARMLNNSTTMGDSSGGVSSEGFVAQAKAKGLKEFLEGIEEIVVKAVLEENDGKIRKTTQDLKISNSTFYRIQERLNNG